MIIPVDMDPGLGTFGRQFRPYAAQAAHQLWMFNAPKRNDWKPHWADDYGRAARGPQLLRWVTPPGVPRGPPLGHVERG